MLHGSAIDRMVPAAHRAGGAEHARRARLLVGLLFVVGPLLTLAGVGSVALRGPNPLGFCLLAGAISLPLSYLALRASSSLWPASSVFLLSSAGAVSTVAWLGYGPQSPAVPSFILVSVVGFFLGGPRGGVALTALCVAQLLLLLGAQRAGYVFPLRAEGDAYVLVWCAAVCGVLVATAGFLTFYDRAWRTADEATQAALSELEVSNASMMEARDAAMAATVAKSQFLATMSHELRTPLNAILGYTEMLAEGAEGESAADLAKIQTSGQHLLALVNDVLDMAAVEAGRLNQQVEPVELLEVGQQVVTSLRPLASRKQLVLTLEGSGSAVSADPMRLRQVLTNLVSNAIKFTDAGQVHVRVDAAGTVTVTDTGRGMSAEECERCFEPFERVRSASGVGGSGLGLAISRKLVEGMGGELHLESERGRGTTFEVRLPLA